MSDQRDNQNPRVNSGSIKTLVIFHDPCLDGFSAAWAAHQALGDDGVEYVGTTYGNPVPEGIFSGEYTKVYILDFSYPRADLEQIAAAVGEENLLVLDHHKTAKQALLGLSYARFSDEESGCVMAWKYFHPGKPVPRLLRYVQDRDLWKFELQDSKEINAALTVQDKDFASWSALVGEANITLGRLFQEGHIVCKTRELLVERCTFAAMGLWMSRKLPASAVAADIIMPQDGLQNSRLTFWRRATDSIHLTNQNQINQ